VLPESESPQVRVILDVRSGTSEGKIVFFDPGNESCERAFLQSRVKSLTWQRRDPSGLMSLA
jgi:hypothetical protein